MKTTRVNTGLYQFDYCGRTFQVEDIKQASDGDCLPGWMAYEITKSKSGGEIRTYLNDYMTKRDAVAKTVDAVDKGY